MEVSFHSFFDSLDDATRAELLSTTQHQIYAPNECIFEEGAPADALYLVLDGEIEIRKQTSPQQVTALSQIGANDFFGEMGLLDGFGRSAAAYTVERCKLALIPADALLHALETLPGSATINLFKKISQRLRKSNQDHVQASYQAERSRLLQAASRSMTHAVGAGLESAAEASLWLETAGVCQYDSITLDKSALPVTELFDELARRAGHYLADRGIEFVLMPCPGDVAVDRPRILIALLNIVLNGAQSITEQSGTITIDAMWRPSEVEITVSDTGKGIPANCSDRIFNPFFTTGKEDALGLGLTAAKQIVEAHGGTIALHSTSDEGTTLQITIPTQ